MDRTISRGATVSVSANHRGPKVTGPGARLAEVLVALEVETPFGGWSRSLETAGWLWVRPVSGVWEPQTATRNDDSQAWIIETLEVASRPDGALRTGRLLRLDGTDWEIVGIVPEGQQMRLELKRIRREPGL